MIKTVRLLIEVRTESDEDVSLNVIAQNLAHAAFMGSGGHLKILRAVDPKNNNWKEEN